MDGVLPDMIKDGGELVKQSLLWLFNKACYGFSTVCWLAFSLNVYLLD